MALGAGVVYFWGPKEALGVTKTFPTWRNTELHSLCKWKVQKTNEFYEIIFILARRSSQQQADDKSRCLFFPSSFHERFLMLVTF